MTYNVSIESVQGLGHGAKGGKTSLDYSGRVGNRHLYSARSMLA